MAAYLSAHSKHVIIFHLVAEGQAYARIERDGRPVSLAAGDIVMFPHGDAHVLGNGPPVPPVDNTAQLRVLLAERGILAQSGRSGELTKLVCGYLTCDQELSQVFLAGLPAIVQVTL